MPNQPTTTIPPADSDRLTRFLLDRAGVRGVRVHLHDTWAQIRGRDDYPPAVAEMLGESAAASALFTYVSTSPFVIEDAYGRSAQLLRLVDQDHSSAPFRHS